MASLPNQWTYGPKYLKFHLTRNIYKSNLRMVSIWYFKKLVKLKEKALTIINFLPDTAPLHEIYKDSKILKLTDCISLQNALLVKHCFDDEFSKLLKTIFKKLIISIISACNLLVYKNCISLHKENTETYGKKWVNFQSMKVWYNWFGRTK